MPAVSKKQLYNFGNNFERAAESIIEAAGIPALIQGANATLPPSRVEVIFQRGAPLNQGLRPNGDLVYDYFSGVLSLRIVTVRPDTQPSLISGVSSLHEEFAATLMELFEETKLSSTNEYITAFTSANLPFYKVLKLQPQTETRDLDPRWLEDFTRHTYLVEFGIRSDAWPA